MKFLWRIMALVAFFSVFSAVSPAQIPSGDPPSETPTEKGFNQKILPGPAPPGESLPRETGIDSIRDKIPDTDDARQKRLRTSQKFLAEAWVEYQAGNYDRAREFFQFARRSSDSEVQSEAELGLAYTFLKTGAKAEALALFESLVQKGYHPDNTIPGLMNLLLENRSWEKAKAIADTFPDKFKEEWLPKITRQEADARSAEVKENLAEGWRQLKDGDLARAKQVFETASQFPYPEINKQARLGLGYVVWKEGHLEEARALFEGLVNEHYRVQDILPDLLQILIDQEDVTAAGKILGSLPGDEKEKWTEKITRIESEQAKREINDRLARAWDQFNAGNLKPAEEQFAPLSQDSDPGISRDAALGLGYTYLQSGQQEKALGIFESLVEQNYRLSDTGPRLMDLLLAAKDLTKARYYLKKLPGNTAGSYTGKVFDLERGLLTEKLARLDPRTPAYRRTAEQILSMNPENLDVRAGLAWACHKAKDFACALEQFTYLRKKAPESGDYLLGMAYTLVELGEKDRALAMLEYWPGRSSGKILELLIQLYKEKARKAYEDEQYAEAETLLGKVLKLEPGNREMLELLAWTYYRQEKTEQALELFRRLYQESKSPDTARNVMMILDQTGRETETHAFISALAAEKERPALQKIAGNYYYDHYQPIRAAQTYRGDDAPYVHYQTPSFRSTAGYRFKDGEAGLSELAQITLPLLYHHPLENGRDLVLGAKIKHLDIGQTLGPPYAGQYYRYVDDPAALKYDMTDSVTVIEPMIGFKKEGWILFEAWLGLTPLGGDIHPSLQFRFLANRVNDWKIDIHQCSVQDSLQSYIGQKDPYSGEQWGRVLKIGVMAEKSFNLSPVYWMTARLGYDHYWGENVVENDSVEGSVSIGRTFKVNPGDLSTGLFLTARHFDRNSDFYTFGHGGYFSPEFFIIAGPFLRFLTSREKDYLVDGSISTGYMQYQTHDNTPHYPLGEADGASLSPQAARDYRGSYEGEDKSGLAVNLNLKAFKLINGYLAVGGDFGINTGSNYTQWYGGLALNFYFKKRKQIIPSDLVDISSECF